MKQTKKNATATQEAIAAQPTTTHAKPLANTSEAITLTLNFEARGMLERYAERNNQTLNEALTDLAQVWLMRAVMKWENQYPDELADVLDKALATRRAD